jgi:hypothetical protein
LAPKQPTIFNAWRAMPPPKACRLRGGATKCCPDPDKIIPCNLNGDLKDPE